MAKTRYSFEKRQREKAKIQKRQEKAQRRAETKKVKTGDQEFTQDPEQTSENIPE